MSKNMHVDEWSWYTSFVRSLPLVDNLPLFPATASVLYPMYHRLATGHAVT